MKIKNGYSDGSGKGTITIDDEGVLRVHWGCGCCDYWNEYEDSSEMRLADFVVEILNKHKKEIKAWKSRGEN